MARLMTPIEIGDMYHAILGDEYSAPDGSGGEFTPGIVDEVIKLFMQKSQGYSGTSMNFGAEGELIEISRKYWKLFGCIVEGKPVVGEPLTEVASDMIGHLLMLIYHLRAESA